MGWKGWLGFRKFKKRKMRGELFPAFQFISVTNDCNLKCQGCWVTTSGEKKHLDIDRIDVIINESKKYGSYFFGILGGEPLMYKSLLTIFEKHPDCYFQLFTNGLLLTDAVAQKLRGLGNVSPLISFEGDTEIADTRRGGKNVYNRAMDGITNATRSGLVTGVAVSVCKSNIDMALSDDFIEMFHTKGVLYIWYYIYRPTGEKPNYELALDASEILRLRKFLVEGRTRYPMVLIDSYWRANGEPFCPAAEGLSHHINANGDIEPCPVIQMARENVSDGNLKVTYENSVFLRDFRTEILQKTKGCVLMEDPKWLNTFATKHDAQNTSGRPHMFEELESAPICTSHGSCEEIPEKNVIYKFAKKTAFFGLGAYG